MHNKDLLKLPPHPRRRRRVRSTRKRMQVRKSQGEEGGEGQVQVGGLAAPDLPQSSHD